MTAESAALDPIDREILGILREDGRIGWTELGARVHLSANAASERVRRMVRAGVITRFTVDVDQTRLGRPLEAVIDVKVHIDDMQRFTDGVRRLPEVTWLSQVTGRTDFQVHVACAGTPGLHDILRRLRDDFGAVETLTTVVLERIR